MDAYQTLLTFDRHSVVTENDSTFGKHDTFAASATDKWMEDWIPWS